MARNTFKSGNIDMLSELKNTIANELFVGMCDGSAEDRKRMMLTFRTFNKYGVSTELVIKVLTEVETKMKGE